MTGRGVDQLFPHPSRPHLHESFVSSAIEYVELAEAEHGQLPRGVDYGYVWGDALEHLRLEDPHARVINLETSITTSEEAAEKGINYRMHPANVPVLSAARIDACALANNHVLDWGVDGLLETLDTLDRTGIHTAGAGRRLADAEAPAILNITGGRVLVFAFGAHDSGIPLSWAAEAGKPGVCLLRDCSDAGVAQVAALVERTKNAGDIAIASIHWGGNWGYDIPSSHQWFARALIDHASVDVVHGHSSHHPRGIEVYNNRPILYGCGDFLNDYEGISGYEQFRGDLVLMYFVTVDSRNGELDQLQMVPLQIHRFRLRDASGTDRAWMRDTLDRECTELGSHVVERENRLVLEWN
jgi:poly-gamma-glutamate synthesis protein (capsule biosynthesis protein)